MRLDSKIQFQRQIESDDGFSKVYTYSNFGKLTWAAKKDISHSENIKLGGEINSQSTIFTVRSNEFTQSLKNTDRILYKQNIFDIKGFKEIGRNDKIQITCAASVK